MTEELLRAFFSGLICSFEVAMKEFESLKPPFFGQLAWIAAREIGRESKETAVQTGRDRRRLTLGAMSGLVDSPIGRMAEE